jgi:hypothetical protein
MASGVAEQRTAGYLGIKCRRVLLIRQPPGSPPLCNLDPQPCRHREQHDNGQPSDEDEKKNSAHDDLRCVQSVCRPVSC